MMVMSRFGAVGPVAVIGISLGIAAAIVAAPPALRRPRQTEA
jgi:hypothetical protein